MAAPNQSTLANGMPETGNSLGGLFASAAHTHPERPALFVGGATYTYRALLQRTLRLARLIDQFETGPLCAVYANRSLGAYAGILGTLLAGRGYVPLNPTFPVARTRAMLEICGASTLVVDRKNLESLEPVVVTAPRNLTVILAESSITPPWASGHSQHRFLCVGEQTGESGDFSPPAIRADSIAYLLFTSGTTGTPKGIAIQQRNVLAYIGAITNRYEIGPEDRFSQNFELIFDPSVHDMFVCWSRGACLCVPSKRAAMAPARFIRDRDLTCWFSTPSTAAVMLRLGMLRPGAFSSLRWSLFCGEPLTVQIAEAWQRAAPQSTVENLYGPTEATVVCTAYRFSAATSPGECVDGIVPIGRPFGQTSVAVVDEKGELVPPGKVGELLLGGAQIAPGYWRDAARTSAAFVSVPWPKAAGPWYRTGDLATVNPQGNLIYRGRLDDQIKIMGHRVELQEVEAVVREASGAGEVAALGWPRTPVGANGTIVFLSGTSAPDEEILKRCRQRLPTYMVPKEIHRMGSLPLSANRKIDRKRLQKLRESLA